MKFVRKLMYYLLGVTLGTLIVIFLFGDRDIQCSYFPNDRVLYDLRKKERVVSDDIREQLQSRGLDTAALSMMLLNGEVDFDKSKAQKEDTCRTYWIEYFPEEQPGFSAEWMNCDSTAYLLQVY